MSRCGENAAVRTQLVPFAPVRWRSMLRSQPPLSIGSISRNQISSESMSELRLFPCASRRKERVTLSAGRRCNTKLRPQRFGTQYRVTGLVMCSRNSSLTRCSVTRSAKSRVILIAISEDRNIDQVTLIASARMRNCSELHHATSIEMLGVTSSRAMSAGTMAMFAAPRM